MLYFVSMPDFLSCTICSVLNCCAVLSRPRTDLEDFRFTSPARCSTQHNNNYLVFMMVGIFIEIQMQLIALAEIKIEKLMMSLIHSR